MSHPERNLKIEYKKRLNPQSYGYTPVGANSVRPPWFTISLALLAHRLCYHKPCRGRRPRRPVVGRPTNYTLSAHGTPTQHCKKINPRHSPKRDVEDAVPYI